MTAKAGCCRRFLPFSSFIISFCKMTRQENQYSVPDIEKIVPTLGHVLDGRRAVCIPSPILIDIPEI